jgi:DNA uptake protein ComE-like DNA-binding protein
MKNRHISIFLAIIILATFSTAAPLKAGDLQVFKGCVLKENKSNDGDSFHVMAGSRSMLVRLYFVDCPETTAWAKSDARRLSEQMRYFGLPSVVDTVHFGKSAQQFTKRVLSEPFTLYTALAGAPGRSSVKRIYGFIETAKGDDLASLLVKNGLARTYGVRRKTPHGVPHDEMSLRLADMEVAAMLKRNGIWAKSDPERIVALRAQQRLEDKRWADIQTQVTASDLPKTKIDLNSAGREQLETVKGIGPSLAAKIIAARPFRTVDDLKSVKGIGEEKFKQLRLHFFVNADKK